MLDRQEQVGAYKMATKKKTVCVVGAGESGIAALKECVLQGMLPTCYDLDSDIGGMWHQKSPDQYSNTPAVWPSLVSNNSKYNVCFSDFPPDPKDPVFMSPKQVCDYMKRAIKHFNLDQYIHLNTRVVKVRESPDHGATGRWEVFTSELTDSRTQAGLDECRREIFDNVIVCTGWYKIPYYPDVPGLDKFKGSVSHSFHYSDPRPYDGKRVLVVGNKFSAAEIASDVANLARETYMVLGSGTWIVPRIFRGGRPLDLNIPRSMVWSRDPEFEFNEFVLNESCSKMDHTQSGVGSSTQPSLSPICISDDLPVKIASGKIKPYGELAEFSHNSVTFKEGETVENLDAAIFCTGYKTDISFVDLKLHDDDGKMHLYMLVFPIHRQHNTLAVVGHYGTDGPMVVMGENQARLAVSVMVGHHRLPGQKEMERSVDFWNQASFARRPGYHNYNIPGFAFMDVLAMEVGFYPSFWKLLLRDPVLAWRTWTGPYLAAQYRLLGPGSQWKQARETCYRGFHEGMSCVRHAGEKTVHRADISRRRRERAVTVTGLGVGLAALVIIKMWWKGQLRW